MNDTFLQEEGKILIAVINDFFTCLQVELNPISISRSLATKMKEHLPECSDDEINGITQEITESLEQNEQDYANLTATLQAGKSREYWLKRQIDAGLAVLSAEMQDAYLNSLDQALKQANEKINSTFITQNGEISLNPNLDGLIAEQYHAQTFNLDAAAQGKTVHADVPQINTKNSVDISVRRTSGGIPDARYQVKYGKTAADTIKLINEGNYNNQRLIVPKEQVAEVQKAFPNKTVLSEIEFDGVRGDSLSKQDAKALQEKAQNGKTDLMNWNQYQIKSLAQGLCKESAKSALLAMAISGGAKLIQDLIQTGEIHLTETGITALKSGTDIFLKQMLAGALKIAAQKGMIALLPPTTPIGVITAIAFAAVEIVKILYQIGKGECPVAEGLGKIQDITLSIAGGFLASAAVGAAIGSIIPGAGTIVGAVVGFAVSTVSYSIGSSFGHAVSEGLKKIEKAAADEVKSIICGIKAGISTVSSMMTETGTAKA